MDLKKTNNIDINKYIDRISVNYCTPKVVN